MRSLYVSSWPSRYLGVSISAGRFDFIQDRLSWFTSVSVEVFGIEAQARTNEWRRQRLELSCGVSMQHKRADETFLEIASRDSMVVQKFQSGFMNTPDGELQSKRSNFRMRTAIRDENGYYRAGISQLRDYTLYGISSFLTYSVHLFGDVRGQVSPGVRYYPSEPLYIWSVGIGLNIPILTEKN